MSVTRLGERLNGGGSGLDAEFEASSSGVAAIGWTTCDIGEFIFW